MLAAGLIAYITRVNVPAAIAATWISNPFTFPFFVYIQYRIGCLILARNHSEIPTHDMMEVIKNAPVPFFVGAFPAAALLAVIVYPLTLWAWDWFHSRPRHAKR